MIEYFKGNSDIHFYLAKGKNKIYINIVNIKW